MQTILGSGGAIGNSLARELPRYTDQVKLVSRNPKTVTGKELLQSADLLNAEDTRKAIDGSEVVYLTAGLPYKAKIWAAQWPVVMKNVIDGCKATGAKLVFFDNIYMYDGNNLSNITEENLVNPPSEKGKVRQQIAQMLMEAEAANEITALIARSADFYGPGIASTSVLNETILKPLSQNKTANILGKPNVKHSFTHTTDAAKATALLGNTPDAYGEVWHLPTATNPPTLKEWVEMSAEIFQVKPKYRAVGKGMLSLLAVFMPFMRELKEMNYQYDRDYVFNSEKFCRRFNYTPIDYREGLETVINSDFRK